MPRYFFHLRVAGDNEVTDNVGTLLDGDVEAVQQAIALVGKVTRQARVYWHECSFQVTDDAGGQVATILFDDVLSFENLTAFGEQRRHFQQPPSLDSRLLAAH